MEKIRCYGDVLGLTVLSHCIVNSKASFESMTYVSVGSGAFHGNAVQPPFDKKLSKIR